MGRLDLIVLISYIPIILIKYKPAPSFPKRNPTIPITNTRCWSCIIYTYHTKNTYSTIPVKYKLAPSFPKRNPIHTQLPYQYSVLVVYNYTYHTKNTYSTIPVNLFLQSLLQVLVSSVTVLAWPRSISDICLKLSFFSSKWYFLFNPRACW